MGFLRGWLSGFMVEWGRVEKGSGWGSINPKMGQRRSACPYHQNESRFQPGWKDYRTRSEAG